jgi:hypothetical protein
MRTMIALLLAAMPLAAQHDMSKMPGMDHTDSTTEPSVMEASGTSTNPASSPMAMIHLNTHRWNLMFHGVAFVTDIQQTGPRGTDKLMALSWFMAEAEHPLAGGTLAVRAMLSLDPATITGREYPELFQTGETAFGKPIVDGQHPHNFVMEAALDYTHPLADRTSWEIYLAPVGDPALGPVAYPHRVSAAELPQATLAHHLEDSTHISYDVVTAGITRGIFHLEASGFHGAEPGENRWDIGHGAIDSCPLASPSPRQPTGPDRFHSAISPARKRWNLAIRTASRHPLHTTGRIRVATGPPASSGDVSTNWQTGRI